MDETLHRTDYNDSLCPVNLCTVVCHMPIPILPQQECKAARQTIRHVIAKLSIASLVKFLTVFKVQNSARFWCRAVWRPQQTQSRHRVFRGGPRAQWQTIFTTGGFDGFPSFFFFFFWRVSFVFGASYKSPTPPGGTPNAQQDYGFCPSESGTGSTNQRFCLEQGILYFLPFWLWSTVGVTFCCQNLCTNERCCCSRSGPAARSLKHAVSDSKGNRVSRFSVWNRVSVFMILSGTGLQNCVSLVWNRVRFSGTQRHTPILHWGEYPPGPTPHFTRLPIPIKHQVT